MTPGATGQNDARTPAQLARTYPVRQRSSRDSMRHSSVHVSPSSAVLEARRCRGAGSRPSFPSGRSRSSASRRGRCGKCPAMHHVARFVTQTVAHPDGGSSGCRSRVAATAPRARCEARQKISAVCFARSFPLCQTIIGLIPRAAASAATRSERRARRPRAACGCPRRARLHRRGAPDRRARVAC